MIQPRDDRLDYIDEPRGTPQWPKRCAYCGALFGQAERMAHVSINFQPPACQAGHITQGEHDDGKL